MATVMTTALDLEAEIRDLAARRDINAAVQRYMRGLDRLDADLQRSAFHADAVIDCVRCAIHLQRRLPARSALAVGLALAQQLEVSRRLGGLPPSLWLEFAGAAA